MAKHIAAAGLVLSGQFTEVESGRNNERPQLALALAQCRITGAALVVAKLDRLARDAKFLLTVVEGAGAGGVTFCDLPTVPPGPVGKFLVTQMAAVAELEAGLISQRTKVALAAAKARGVVLGGYKGGPYVSPEAGLRARQERAAAHRKAVQPIAAELRAGGLSLAAIAAELQARGVQTRKGGQWTATGVMRVLAA